MTGQEWDQIFWAEFSKLRKSKPAADLFLVQKAARTYMEKRYGARPPDKVETSPPWWMKLGAVTIGVPMGFLTGLWAWLNGKKTVIGAILTAIGVAVGYMPAVLAFFGVEADKIVTIVGVATTVVGVLHKIYKWIYKEEHP